MPGVIELACQLSQSSGMKIAFVYHFLSLCTWLTKCYWHFTFLSLQTAFLYPSINTLQKVKLDIRILLFENRVLTRTNGPEREEVTGGW